MKRGTRCALDGDDSHTYAPTRQPKAPDDAATESDAERRRTRSEEPTLRDGQPCQRLKGSATARRRNASLSKPRQAVMKRRTRCAPDGDNGCTCAPNRQPKAPADAACEVDEERRRTRSEEPTLRDRQPCQRLKGSATAAAIHGVRGSDHRIRGDDNQQPALGMKRGECTVAIDVHLGVPRARTQAIAWMSDGGERVLREKLIEGVLQIDSRRAHRIR